MLRQELSILLFCEGYTYGGGYPVSERQKEYLENKQSNNIQKPSTHVTLQGGVWVPFRSLSVPRSHLNPSHPTGPMFGVG
jgi:hypothetical protein